MEEHATRECSNEGGVHADRLDCPDTVIHHYNSGHVGIPIHDGGHSFIVVHYCPWCGASLA
jgi:hypothetical protein